MECPVCMVNDATIKLSKCGHLFCTACAREWFTRNEDPTCPMCRGPFKFKGCAVWVEEKRNRDLCFEDGVNAILEADKVYSWLEVDVRGERVFWGDRISKIKKLAEFQLAYNKMAEMEWEWEDEDDLIEFALNEPLKQIIKTEPVVYLECPKYPWFTRYPLR